jgi:hypothetical protein
VRLIECFPMMRCYATKEVSSFPSDSRNRGIAGRLALADIDFMQCSTAIVALFSPCRLCSRKIGF